MSRIESYGICPRFPQNFSKDILKKAMKAMIVKKVDVSGFYVYIPMKDSSGNWWATLSCCEAEYHL